MRISTGFGILAFLCMFLALYTAAVTEGTVWIVFAFVNFALMFLMGYIGELVMKIEDG